LGAQVIKHPMDLGTVNARLADDFYTDPERFISDVRQVSFIFANYLKSSIANVLLA
jgi:hypothetical protein